MSYTRSQPAAPRVGGAPALPLQRRPFIRPGTYPGLGALTWDQFTAVQGGTREYTDGGVIITPKASEPVVISEPVPTSEPVQFVTSVPTTDGGAGGTLQPDGPMYTPTGPDFSLLPGLPLEGGGGGSVTTPVNVSVVGPEGAQDEGDGFGMVEAALGAAVAALLAMAWQRRK